MVRACSRARPSPLNRIYRIVRAVMPCGRTWRTHVLCQRLGEEGAAAGPREAGPELPVPQCLRPATRGPR